MLNLLPLTFFLMFQTSSQAEFNCRAYVEEMLIESKCEQELNNPAAGQHRVEVAAPLLKFHIQYRCKGASAVQVRTEPFAITLDVRELEDGVWYSRGLGKVEWDNSGLVHNAELPKLGGGCSSEKGFSLIRTVSPQRKKHLDAPLPSQGRNG